MVSVVVVPSCIDNASQYETSNIYIIIIIITTTITNDKRHDNPFDPDGSHMLVSQIKPCTCKLIRNAEKLRMAH